MTFEEFWTRQQYTEDYNDKDFAQATWEAAFNEGYERGKAGFEAAILAEREACAKICDVVSGGVFNKADMCAEAIRARTKK